MELLEGESLSQRLARVGTLPLGAAAAITLQVADALGAAHAAGVVHRDLKPENIFLCAARDHVKVLDFGVAKLRGRLGNGGGLTRGGVLGTPRYMAPEQWRSSETVDDRADIYALGLVLTEMLRGTGQAGATGAATTPVALARVIAKATAAQPEQRHGSMRAFAADLRDALNLAEAADRKAPRRQYPARLPWIAAAGAALTLTGLFAWKTRPVPRSATVSRAAPSAAAGMNGPGSAAAGEHAPANHAQTVETATWREKAAPARDAPEAGDRSPHPQRPARRAAPIGPVEAGPVLPSFLRQNPY